MTKDTRPCALKIGDRVEIIFMTPIIALMIGDSFPEPAPEGVTFHKEIPFMQELVGKMATVIEVRDADYHSPAQYGLNIDDYGEQWWFDREQLKHQP